ncbi:DNA-binding protein snt1 [Tritrichomonas musculus]|uniref:DNA-binding protein snt1 n=1 Tax=Tritrichomonas musculus TaxID=1915356 RepID=A0ABR2INQ6_9EUKA
MSANPPRQPAIKRFNITDAGVSIPPDPSHNISNNINVNQSQAAQPRHSLPTSNAASIPINQPIHSSPPIAGNVVLMYNNNNNNSTNSSNNNNNNSTNSHKPPVHTLKRLVQQQQQQQQIPQMQPMGQSPNSQVNQQKSNPKIISSRPNTPPPINYNVSQLQIQQQQQQQLLPIHHMQQQQIMQQQIYCPPTQQQMQQQMQMQAIHSPGRNYLSNGAPGPSNGQMLMAQQQQIQYQIQQQQMMQQQQMQQIQQQQYQQQQMQQIQHQVNTNTGAINGSPINDMALVNSNVTKGSSKSSRASKSDLNNINANISGHQNKLQNNSTGSNNAKNSNKAKNQHIAELRNDDSNDFLSESNNNNSEINNLSNLFIRDPPPISAAYYPVLPGKREVQLLLKKVDFELKETKQQLSELNKLKQKNLLVKANFETLDPSLMVQSHLGMIISHIDVKRITDDNKKRTTKMHNQYHVTNPKIDHRIMHHSHLGYLQRNIDTNSENIEHFFNAAFNWKKMAEEKGRNLARQYSERHQIWENASKALNAYHNQERAVLNEWPPEMIPLLPKPKDNASLRQWTAPDQPMYLDDIEFYSYAFYTMNAFVPDPVKAHKEYKQRLTWTSAEKQIFLDKYRLHPREFKKIAAGLPHKCVKDVIEYYYCHRIDLNLKEIEQQSKKRGRKKVITEGSVRK